MILSSTRIPPSMRFSAQPIRRLSGLSWCAHDANKTRHRGWPSRRYPHLPERSNAGRLATVYARNGIPDQLSDGSSAIGTRPQRTNALPCGAARSAKSKELASLMPPSPLPARLPRTASVRPSGRAEQAVRAPWREVGERRLVEPTGFHHAVLGQVVHDQVDELDLVGRQRLARRGSRPKASLAASRSSPTSERTNRPSPCDSSPWRAAMSSGVADAALGEHALQLGEVGRRQRLVHPQLVDRDVVLVLPRGTLAPWRGTRSKSVRAGEAGQRRPPSRRPSGPRSRCRPACACRFSMSLTRAAAACARSPASARSRPATTRRSARPGSAASARCTIGIAAFSSSSPAISFTWSRSRSNPGSARSTRELEVQHQQIEPLRLLVLGVELRRQPGDLVRQLRERSSATASPTPPACAYFSTSRRCGRTTKLSRFIAATSPLQQLSGRAPHLVVGLGSP